MRLFIAIEIPDNVKTLLRDTQSDFKKTAVLKPVNDFHLTLKFLGEVSENKLITLTKLLSVISFSPFTITISTRGVFPNPHNPRVLWVGISEQSTLIDLQNLVQVALPDFPDNKEFHPHITLARIKSITNRSIFDSLLSQTEESLSFKVSEFKLIKSTLTPNGPVYETLHTFISEYV